MGPSSSLSRFLIEGAEHWAAIVDVKAKQRGTLAQLPIRQRGTLAQLPIRQCGM